MTRPGITVNAEAARTLGGSSVRSAVVFAFALFCMVLTCALVVFIALQEPSVGWRFVPDPQGQGVLAFDPGDPLKISRREQAVHRVVAIRARSGDAPAPVLGLPGVVAVEAPSMLPHQAELNQFFDLQRALWAVLEQGRSSGQGVALQLADGRWINAGVHQRRWGELGWLFWVPLLCGVVPFVVGVGIGIYRWSSVGARFLGAASIALLASLGEVSLMTGKLWVVAPWMLEWGQIFVRCTSLAAGWAFLMMLVYYPTPLKTARLWARVSAGLLLVLVLLNALQWPHSQTLRYKLPFLLILCLVMGLGVWQALAARADPVQRAAARWLGGSIFLAVSVVAAAFLVSVVYEVQIISTAYRWLTLPLLFIGMVLSVGRHALFELERWWVPVCLWYVGGVLVVAADLALVAVLRFDPGAAISVALLLMGWVYFPLRQWLLVRLKSWSRPTVSTYIADLIGAINAGLGGAMAAHQAWRDLLQRVFAPARIEWQGAPTQALALASVADQGRELRVFDVSGQGVWVLMLAHGGRNLFTPAHARVADELRRLLEVGLQQQQQAQQAVVQERQRIAADLHDDLGAQLLSIAQAGKSDRTAALARRALADMRESVRGLSGHSVLATQVFADWRAEAVSRLTDAGLTVQWQALAPPAALVLSARMQVQLTRVLREAVSNLIRHSGATHGRIGLACDAGRLVLDVEDDGQGLSGFLPGNEGHGLLSIESRVRKLGGTHEFLVSGLGGVHLHVSVPLAPVEPVAGAVEPTRMAALATHPEG